MEQTEKYGVEASSAPLSPKPQSTNSVNSTNPTDPVTQSPSINNSLNCSVTTTPYSKIAISPEFETLYEKSHDDCLNQLNSTFADTKSPEVNLNETSSSTRRKRKYASPDSLVKTKRTRNISYSDKSRRKISQIFKTPLDYFSHRRRTIGAVNKSLNDSVMSTSGIFDVSTVESLNKFDGNNSFAKKIRRSLFNNSFTSSKFGKSKKKQNLNSTKSSFGDESVCDGLDTMNSTCFPDFPPYLAPDSESWMRRDRHSDHPGPSFSHASVLTSFHSIQIYASNQRIANAFLDFSVFIFINQKAAYLQQIFGFLLIIFCIWNI